MRRQAFGYRRIGRSTGIQDIGTALVCDGKSRKNKIRGGSMFASEGKAGKRGAAVLRMCCSAIALCAGVAPAWAQDAPAPVAPPPATVEGARTFTPEDFARFKPLTALDMLRQVPGFSIREATQERGLGQATGNVLINGQRISGKSNDVITELSRVPAKNVIRIDIVDGATLDVPGLSGQVANIIAKAGDISGQFAWRPEFREVYVDPVFTRGEVSVSGKRGALDYTLGLQNQGGGGGAGGGTYIYNADYSFRNSATMSSPSSSTRPG
jgi:hypothetical protein